jgi:hypothetical protein
MTKSKICSICAKPNPTGTCGVCHDLVCKSCVEILPEESFLFAPDLTENYIHKTYCSVCFDQNVAPILKLYNETLTRAHDVIVFYKTQNKETRTVRRQHEPITITDRPDRDLVLLELAFWAAKENYNALVDVEINSKKVGKAGYFRSAWSGSGVPVKIDPNSPMVLKAHNKN